MKNFDATWVLWEQLRKTQNELTDRRTTEEQREQLERDEQNIREAINLFSSGE